MQWFFFPQLELQQSENEYIEQLTGDYQATIVIFFEKKKNNWIVVYKCLAVYGQPGPYHNTSTTNKELPRREVSEKVRLPGKSWKYVNKAQRWSIRSPFGEQGLWKLFACRLDLTKHEFRLLTRRHSDVIPASLQSDHRSLLVLGSYQCHVFSPHWVWMWHKTDTINSVTPLAHAPLACEGFVCNVALCKIMSWSSVFPPCPACLRCFPSPAHLYQMNLSISGCLMTSWSLESGLLLGRRPPGTALKNSVLKVKFGIHEWRPQPKWCAGTVACCVMFRSRVVIWIACKLKLIVC